MGLAQLWFRGGQGRLGLETMSSWTLAISASFWPPHKAISNPKSPGESLGLHLDSVGPGEAPLWGARSSPRCGATRKATSNPEFY